MARFIDIVNGVLTQLVPIATSSGSGDASKVVQTDASGRFDASFMPSSITGQVKILPASEALAAGDLVNIWDDSGTIKVRLADASLSRSAVGYVSAGATTGADATVYVEGINTQVSGLTPGLVWLGDAGAVTQTPPASGSGGISQIVGSFLAATELEFEANDPITLASA
jgi:hypothetical protein